MPRLSKKAKHEWSVFIDTNTGRRRYNDLCRRCMHDCTQSYKSHVIECRHYVSKRSISALNAP